MTDRDLPAMTRAEQDLVEHYLRVVDLVARLNPAGDGAHQEGLGSVLAAQALVSEARRLLAAAETMRDRGETELHVATLGRAMRVLDGERRMGRIRLPPA
jgi:hypothetical protein